MVIRGSTFTAYIDTLTRNTCVMMVISDPSISKIEKSDCMLLYDAYMQCLLIAPAATQMNIAAARPHFERLESVHNKAA